MINPGRYRHKIDILRCVDGRDEYGEPIDDWEVFKTIWASKDPIIGRELFAAFTTDVKVDVKFNARYIPGVTNDMRVKHGGEEYEIISAVDVKSMHEELLIYCKAVKDDGVNDF